MTEQDPFRTTPSTPRGADTPATEAMPQAYVPPAFGQQEAPTWAAQPAPGTTGGQPAQYSQPVQYSQPGPYDAAPAPYGGATASATRAPYDGVSIAALVTGVLTLPLVAIVLGAVGLRRTAAGVRRGTWMAVTGLVLGLLATIMWTGIITGAIVAGVNYAEDNGVTWDEITDTATSYGDDPELDALYDQCAAGDDGACDDLYDAAPFGSEYEDFAYDCGGRGLPADQLYCEP